MRKWWYCLIVLIPVYFCLGVSNPTFEIVSERAEKKMVEIKGEVMNPGVYELAWEATIADALHAAGGVCETGDTAGINQTQQMQHGDVLIIPAKRKQTCISINTATAEQLDTLPGIGAKMAQRIIAEREQAPFVSLEDIKRVKGIGDKLFERMKSEICL